jgi:hypothetical protein
MGLIMSTPFRDFSTSSNEAVAWYPGKLWSLWDMFRIYGDKYIELGVLIANMRTVLHFTDDALVHGERNKSRITKDEQTDFKRTLKETIKICDDLDLSVHHLISHAYDDLPQTSREFDLLIRAILGELKDRLFLYVPQHRAKYYERTLQDFVTEAFPLASNELVNAGNAFAVGLYTATVFHSMRAAEIGVRVLGKGLGVEFPDKPLELAEWQNILDQADSKIVDMKNLRRGTHKDEELKFYSQAAIQFRYFKDAWRVRVAHARETYEESAALKVFNHTLEFFETLATRLKEPKPSI